MTTSLPAAACIFHDVTTSNNDVGCLAGSLDCYTRSGAPGGVLSLKGASALAIAYPAGAGYDEATGLGTLNVANLINNWRTAFTSSTSLTVNPTSITTAQSTTLTATVKSGTPHESTGAAPALKGTVTFKDGSVTTGSCTLSGSSCSVVVSGSSLQVGANAITATFVGSGTYPSSTSNTVTVTVTSAVTGGFTVTPLPAAETIKRGVLGGFVVKLTSTNGFSGTVTMSCSGGPVGTKCTDFPVAVKLTSTAYALSGIIFPANATPGTYTITFKGVSGSVASSATANFTIY